MTISLDHKRQRKTKEEEKKKEHEELKEYFTLTCNNLIESIQKQLDQLDSLIKQIDANPYGGYTHTIIPEMNLDKIYYITPLKAHEIFTSNKQADIKSKQKSLSTLYNTFDKIQGVKELQKEVSETFRKEFGERSDGFWDTAFKLKQFQRRLSYEVTMNNVTKLDCLMDQFREIVKASDNLTDPTIGKEYDELFMKSAKLFNSDNEYLKSQYWSEFALVRDQAGRFKTLCEVATSEFKRGSEDSKTSLRDFKGIIETELKALLK